MFLGVQKTKQSEFQISGIARLLKGCMRFLVRICSALLVVFLNASLILAGPSAIRYEASHRAMGTVYTIVVYGRDEAYLSEVVTEAFERIDQLDEQMSNYNPESEISVINRQAARQPVRVEPKLFHLIQQALRYSRETDGAFDPTVGPLMKRWGFFRGHGQLPSQAQIAQALRCVGYQNIRLDVKNRTIRFEKGGIELDLGAIAKGYTVDRVVDILRSNGITTALVSSGTSSIYALGSPPGDQGWKVTVRDPYDRNKPGDVFHLQNWSLSVSGNYEKFFTIGGKTYCHIMDPRTGQPVQGMLSTAVLAPSATESDGLSTTFFVLGPDGTYKFLATNPNLEVVIYRPVGQQREYRRTVLRSRSLKLPPETLVHLEE